MRTKTVSLEISANPKSIAKNSWNFHSLKYEKPIKVCYDVTSGITMHKKDNILVILLLIVLCAISISFRANHERLKNEALILRNERITERNKKISALNCPKSIARKPIFVLYAQIFEDTIPYDVLGDVKDDLYIDVGANHPVVDSVTKLFYEQGDHRINIEHLLPEYDMLRQDTPPDINLCVCAGAENGELEFYEMGGLSPSDINITKIWNKVSQPRKVKVVSFSKICEEYCLKGQEIQLCKIDVEGFEREVRLGFDFQNFKPKICVIEATEPCTVIPPEQK